MSSSKRRKTTKSANSKKDIYSAQSLALQLYGLYSAEEEGRDYCSGCYFPILYFGQPAGQAPSTDTTAAPIATPTDPSTSSTSTDPAASPTPAAAANNPPSIMVRWSSKESSYEPEELSTAYVRQGNEFKQLETENMIMGKRVLVREIMEAQDFEGVCYYLATIVTAPKLPPNSSKDNSSSSASSASSAAAAQAKKKRPLDSTLIEVEYQNTMWDRNMVPASSIYVLPKQKALLKLVEPTPQEKQRIMEQVQEAKRKLAEEAAAEAEGEEEETGMNHETVTGFAHSSPKLTATADDILIPSSPASSTLAAPTTSAVTDSVAEPKIEPLALEQELQQ